MLKFKSVSCCFSLAVCIAVASANVAISAEGENDFGAERLQVVEIVRAAEKADHVAIAGQNGWLFFVPELRAISIGRFWGNNAASVSRASKTEYADPLSAISDFHRQLKNAGIELLLVPVPAKAAIYPEQLLSDLPKTEGQQQIRLDKDHQQFYDQLRKLEIDVIDLVPLFLKERNSPEGPLYCKTDSHWSGRGVMVAAAAIADQIRRRPWLNEVRVEKFDAEPRTIMIQGDLARMIDEVHPVSETLTIMVCGEKQARGIVPIQAWRESPVLLMGDSHTLVFHDPTLFASGAGLPDHLARQLGFAVDLVGVRGSGATTARIELQRRKDNLQGKRIVIWCFSIREFTESETGWRKVPVIRP